MELTLFVVVGVGVLCVHKHTCSLIIHSLLFVLLCRSDHLQFHNNGKHAHRKQHHQPQQQQQHQQHQQQHQQHQQEELAVEVAYVEESAEKFAKRHLCPKQGICEGDN
eukprot:GHVS01002075.1.p2 GENE.GHVS01002075.1~~GHVS01002075.1.p2  ORF type:complete len:108 (-),score=41.99 GHVS01002075.1:348-671(-)